MLVLDANNLIRAALGLRVPTLILKYCEKIRFVAPETALDEALRCLDELIVKKGVPREDAIGRFLFIATKVRSLEHKEYSRYETAAHARIDRRDPNDWPMVAAALQFKCPVWTEDLDFFGCGIATWTTDRVGLFLESAAKRPN